jgi:hypothetical protein
MKKNSSSRKRMQMVMIIAFGWAFFAGILFLVEYFFVLDLLVMEKLSGSYYPWTDFTGSIILGAIDGFIAGYILIFRLGSRYRKKSFAFGIIYSGLLFIVIYLAFGISGLFIMDFIYFVFRMDFLSAVTTSWSNVLFNMRAPSFFIYMGVWAFLACCTQFILQVSDKFGPEYCGSSLLENIITHAKKKGSLCFWILNPRQPLQKKPGVINFSGC